MLSLSSFYGYGVELDVLEENPVANDTAQRRLPTRSARSPASRRLSTTGQRLQRGFDVQHLRFALTTRDSDPAPATVPS